MQEQDECLDEEAKNSFGSQRESLSIRSLRCDRKPVV
jgi:hypothetical protein